jgi:DMSO/TMAO reductase YedYZ molybdopterin-dependent catalytic subunit
MLVACNQQVKEAGTTTSFQSCKRRNGKAEGKDSMILLTDKPANLETPLKYFKQDFTPNSVFFVRWHLSKLPGKIDLDTFRLRITGNVEQELALSYE